MIVETQQGVSIRRFPKREQYTGRVSREEEPEQGGNRFPREQREHREQESKVPQGNNTHQTPEQGEQYTVTKKETQNSQRSVKVKRRLMIGLAMIRGYRFAARGAVPSRCRGSAVSSFRCSRIILPPHPLPCKVCSSVPFVVGVVLAGGALMALGMPCGLGG